MNKDLADLLERLDEEAAEVCSGSHMHRLCSESADTIRQLQKLVEGGDIGRKVMSVDLETKGRLVGDYLTKVEELDRLVAEVMAERDMWKEEVGELTAAYEK